MMECRIRDVGLSSAGAIGRGRFSDMNSLNVKFLRKGEILSRGDGVGGVNARFCYSAIALTSFHIYEYE